MGCEEFAAALWATRENMGLSREDFGAGINVSGTTIQKWEIGAVFPKPSRWKAIKLFSGIDPADYRERPTTQITGNRNTGITATNGANVSVSSSTQTTTSVQLSPEEIEALQVIRKIGPKALEALELFGQYGNEHILDTCIARLHKVKAALS